MRSIGSAGQERHINGPANGGKVISDEALAWFFMGEGSFGIHLEKCPRVRTGFRFVPRALVVNKDLALIREIELWLKLRGFKSQIRKQERPNGAIYALTMARGYEPVKRLIEIFLPHLKGVKKREANMLKRFIEQFGRKKGSRASNPREEWERYIQALAYVDHFRSYDPRRKSRARTLVALKTLSRLRGF
jgi:hypothetical protein